MYLDGFWYLLKAKPELYEGKDVVGQLDSQILQDVVLGPVLGIGDPRTDKRIKFVGGSHKLRDFRLWQMRPEALRLRFILLLWKI